MQIFGHIGIYNFLKLQDIQTYNSRKIQVKENSYESMGLYHLVIENFNYLNVAFISYKLTMWN